MPLADLIRREADAFARMAATGPKEQADVTRMVAVKLRNIAGVVEVHGLAGLHGYMACLHFSHSVTDQARNTVIDIVNRILRGEAH
jgi:hypothetical protein